MSGQDLAGREARFEQLYRSTAQDLLAFLRRRASDPEAATDILAEVYLIAWRRLDDIPAKGEERLWLFGVARNLLLASHRQHRSHQALVRDITRELYRAANNPAEPDDEFMDKVRASVNKLPAAQREVLLLTAWEELKPREIAKVTGSTANLVRVRLHNARRQLRRELRPPATPAGTEDAPADPLQSAPAPT
jgi:RNA polymerase sigma-70 factor (ECF subfamily)